MRDDDLITVIAKEKQIRNTRCNNYSTHLPTFIGYYNILIHILYSRVSTADTMFAFIWIINGIILVECDIRCQNVFIPIELSFHTD